MVKLTGQVAVGSIGNINATFSNVALPHVNLSMSLGKLSVTGSQTSSIKEASVSFHTVDGDKNNDTWVTTQIVCDGKSIAGRSEPYGRFSKESSNGPFQLPLIETTAIDRFSSNCSLSIHINPSSRDVWRFDSNLDISFADKSHKTFKWENIQLDHNKWKIEFPLLLKD